MPYEYLVFRPTHRLSLHDEINEETIVPFVSNNAILILLRQIYPDARVDSNGYGWLNPAEYDGELRFSRGNPLTFFLAYITRADVQALCTALDLTALDVQTMELIHPAEEGSFCLKAE